MLHTQNKQMQASNKAARFFYFPLTKIIVALIACLGILVISQIVAAKFLLDFILDKDHRNLLKGLLVSVMLIGSYILLFRYYEKRRISELSAKGLGKNVLSGLAIGTVLQCLTFLVISLFGEFEIVSQNPWTFMIVPFSVALTVAVIEEILIRGIIFRIIEERLGSYAALVISAVIFGALHLANPNSTLITGLCITIQAGLLFGAAYIYSRNLWFLIAIHFAWNFMQSGIFGAVTSGTEKTGSLLNTKISGSTLITGGEFGPEATIQATLFCLTATMVLMYLNHKQNKIIRPNWLTKKEVKDLPQPYA